MSATINRRAAYLVAGFFALLASMAFAASQSAIGLVFLIVGPTLAVLIHELGHAVAAWLLGMRVLEVVVGPFTMVFRPRPRIGLSKRVFGRDVGGYVRFDDTRGKYLTRGIDNCIAAAGPVSNLLSGIIAWSVAFAAPNDLSANLLVGFAFVSLSAFIISAWPFTMVDGFANDAMQIVRNMRSARPHRATQRKGRSPWQAP